MQNWVAGLPISTVNIAKARWNPADVLIDSWTRIAAGRDTHRHVAIDRHQPRSIGVAARTFFEPCSHPGLDSLVTFG